MTQVTMTPEQVKCLVKGKGTKIATVSFVKSDGTVRTVNGLFKPSSKIVGSERGVAQGKQMASQGRIPVYELSSKQWRSFYITKVINIT